MYMQKVRPGAGWEGMSLARGYREGGDEYGGCGCPVLVGEGGRESWVYRENVMMKEYCD